MNHRTDETIELAQMAAVILLMVIGAAFISFIIYLLTGGTL